MNWTENQQSPITAWDLADELNITPTAAVFLLKTEGWIEDGYCPSTGVEMYKRIESKSDTLLAHSAKQDTPDPDWGFVLNLPGEGLTKIYPDGREERLS